jgi:DNA repair protein RadA/Sms
MLLAVLEKRAGYRFGNADVFLNIAGGLRIEDPGIDLAVCAALISSYNDQNVGSDICYAAEVGLGGELRNVSRLDRRIQEAEKLGFKKIIVASQGSKIKTNGNLEVVALGNIHAVIQHLV